MARSLLLAIVLFFFPASVRADLGEYIRKAEPKYSWKLVKKTEILVGTVYEIRLTSQVWEGITWEHALAIIQPRNVKPTATMLLWNTGGPFKITDIALALSLAEKAQSPVAFLYGIPNQPLLGDLKEDALISETFVRYLNTKDEDWPLLFPMTKSLVKAMDCIQSFAKEEWKFDVKDFVVSGASKRGWTTWLTAATGDPRVKAIAPLVIDMLNFAKQNPLQIASFGEPSEQIKDYTEKGLLKVLDQPHGRKLWAMVDPWMYRDKIAVPKMMINGTNDPYWPLEATNMYWDDLKGDKYLLYVPNAGHNLQQNTAENPKDWTRVVNSLAVYADSIIHEKPMPKLEWTHKEGEKLGSYQLSVKSDKFPKTVRLWQAENDTRDLRKSTWTSTEIPMAEGRTIVSMNAPTKGWKAFLIECEYDRDGLSHFLSTQLRMISK